MIVVGKPWNTAGAHGYVNMKEALLPVVLESLEELRRRFDVVVCEGAGSPAEINLRENDLVNMGLARAANLPVVVVGDIDRGGMLASFYGTLALLSEKDQAHVGGFLVNKFRGDPALLAPGLDQLSQLTGRPILGTLPYATGLSIDGEDSVALDAPRGTAPPLGKDILRVAVARLARISIFTDYDALAHEPGVTVSFTASPSEILAADLAVIPGTKATVADLAQLREWGLDEAFAERARRGLPTLGVCGGYQMLGTWISDNVESEKSETPGLSLLPVETVFEEEKLLIRPEGRAPRFGDAQVSGYEIRHGRVCRNGGESLFISDGSEEGCRIGAVFGTSWHGVMESDGFRRRFLRFVAEARNLDWVPGEQSFSDAREARLEKLGDLIADNVDREALMRLIDSGPPRRLPTLSPRLTNNPAPKPVREIQNTSTGGT